MKTDLFQFCGHCQVFQICWHIECSTFTASSFRILNSSTGIPSPPLALFRMMVPKAFIAKFRVKLKKVGKTTRPFRYELNQIPYDYTVGVRNRFKGLDLVDRVLKNYGRMLVTLNRRQRLRPSLRKRNAKKQNGCLSRPYK